jgi:broad-specificity NMP kinase
MLSPGLGGPREWTAITGTPGSGKSEVGRRLRRRWEVVEVAELAKRLGCARARPGGSLEIDMIQLGRAMRTPGTPRRGSVRARHSLLTGHLAHLLPVRDVIVLRCGPRELARRLRRRGTPTRDIWANVASEATDVVLIEAASRRGTGRLWEVDTTGRLRAAVARTVAGLLRNRPRSEFGHVDWLADPRVTAQLLRGAH